MNFEINWSIENLKYFAFEMKNLNSFEEEKLTLRNKLVEIEKEFDEFAKEHGD